MGKFKREILKRLTAIERRLSDIEQPRQPWPQDIVQPPLQWPHVPISPTVVSYGVHPDIGTAPHHQHFILTTTGTPTVTGE